MDTLTNQNQTEIISVPAMTFGKRLLKSIKDAKPVLTRFSLLLAVAALAATPANAATVTVDPAPTTLVFDNFNDGVDTATNFFNTSSLGEAGGVSTIQIPVAAGDPQFGYNTPAGINPFDIAAYPYLRIQAKGSSAASPAQIFPFNPDGATALTVLPPTIIFAESQHTFVAAASTTGTGLRIDPLGGGTANVESYSVDYIMLDQVQTISLGEFDRDGGLDGWIMNPDIVGANVSAATSTFAATTSGVDPIMQKVGFSIDTNIFDTIEFRIAVDPASNSRFEFFWGTNTHPGPAGGQSIQIIEELIRDGNLHTYRFDMSGEANWDGLLNLMRIDPLADADAAAGRSIEIDYIRVLASPPSAVVPEPGTFALAALGMIGFVSRRRRKVAK